MDGPETSGGRPFRQVRALYSPTSVRVYQAYSPLIAARAMAAQTFKGPFRRDRMTWIKPSFTWMMYRAGWAKRPGQERILAVDILRDGFEWALANSSLAHFDRTVHPSVGEWRAIFCGSPVRIQWDPERTVALQALPWRAIQIGLQGEAVDSYLDKWIVRIDDVTGLARQMGELVARQDFEAAEAIRPVEVPYPLSKEIAARIGCAATKV